MKKSKKILSLLLALTVVMSSLVVTIIPVSAALTNGGSDTGEVANHITFDGGTGTANVTDPLDANNVVYKHSSGSDSDPWTFMWVDSDNAAGRFEFDVMFDAYPTTGNSAYGYRLRLYNPNADILFFSPDGYLYTKEYLSNSDAHYYRVGNYVPDKWYTIAIEFTQDRKFFAVYIKEKGAAEFNMANQYFASGTYSEEFRFGMWIPKTDGTNTDHTVYYDNLKFNTIAEPDKFQGWDFNNVQDKSGVPYFSGHEYASEEAKVSYTQGEYDGEKVLKVSLYSGNAEAETGTYATIENEINTGNIIFETSLGYNSTSVPYIGIRPRFDASNKMNGAYMGRETSNYIHLGNTKQDNIWNNAGVLSKIGFVYDKTNGTMKAYGVGDNGVLAVQDVSNSFITSKTNLLGVQLWTKMNAAGQECYFDYATITKAGAFKVENVYPANGAANVAIDSAVKLDMNYVLDPKVSYTATITPDGGQAVEADVAVENGDVVVISPKANLENSKKYTVSLSGAMDLLGTEMAAYTSTFTTSAPTAQITGSSNGNYTYTASTVSVPLYTKVSALKTALQCPSGYSIEVKSGDSAVDDNAAVTEAMTVAVMSGTTVGKTYTVDVAEKTVSENFDNLQVKSITAKEFDGFVCDNYDKASSAIKKNDMYGNYFEMAKPITTTSGDPLLFKNITDTTSGSKFMLNVVSSVTKDTGSSSLIHTVNLGGKVATWAIEYQNGYIFSFGNLIGTYEVGDVNNILIGFDIAADKLNVWLNGKKVLDNKDFNSFDNMTSASITQAWMMMTASSSYEMTGVLSKYELYHVDDIDLAGAAEAFVPTSENYGFAGSGIGNIGTATAVSTLTGGIAGGATAVYNVDGREATGDVTDGMYVKVTSANGVENIYKAVTGTYYVNKPALTVGEDILGEVTVANYDKTMFPVFVAIAQYKDGNELVAINIFKTTSVAVGEEIFISERFDKNSEATSYKMFVFDSLDSLNPYVAADEK